MSLPRNKKEGLGVETEKNKGAICKLEEVMLPPIYTYADFEIADGTIVGITAMKLENSRVIKNFSIEVSQLNSPLVVALKMFVEFAGMDPIFISSNLDATMNVFNSCCHSVGIDLIPNSIHQLPVSSAIPTH